MGLIYRAGLEITVICFEDGPEIYKRMLGDYETKVKSLTEASAKRTKKWGWKRKLTVKDIKTKFIEPAELKEPEIDCAKKVKSGMKGKWKAMMGKIGRKKSSETLNGNID